MTIPEPWLLAFSITALLLLPGTTSGLVDSELWMSEPAAASVVAHGITGTDLSVFPGRSRQREDPA